MDAGSNNSQISNVGIDFIEQVTVKTSNFSAEYGRNSGAAINVVTRSGTNTFKGSAYEYMRRDAWDTNDWFDQQEGRREGHADLRQPRLRPRRADREGQDLLLRRHGVEADPPLHGADHPDAADSRDAQRRFQRAVHGDRRPAHEAAVHGQHHPGQPDYGRRPRDRERLRGDVEGGGAYDDSVLTNNTVFQDDNPFDFRQEMLRLDYQPSGAHRLTARLVFDHYNLIEPGGTFISSQLPTVPTNRKRPGRNVQVNHYWTLRNNLVNEAKFNYSGNGQMIPPVGDAWKRSTYGFAVPAAVRGRRQLLRQHPERDDPDYATFRGANASLLSPTWDYSFRTTSPGSRASTRSRPGASGSTTRRTRTAAQCTPAT